MNNTSQIIAVLALIIALIALVLAWTAFNRTGADFEEVVQREVDQAMIEMNTNLEQFERSYRESLTDDMRERASTSTLEGQVEVDSAD
ncbi:MAG: hypothetical protein WDZ56_00615 [Candidatus Paceibacterota bacterium]